MSSGSNQGPLNPALQWAVRDRIAALRAVDPGNERPLPVDPVTASGSGFDLHLSLAAAEYHLTEANVRKPVQQASAGRTLSIHGEPRVNVLELSLLLDEPVPR